MSAGDDRQIREATEQELEKQRLIDKRALTQMFAMLSKVDRDLLAMSEEMREKRKITLSIALSALANTIRCGMDELPMRLRTLAKEAACPKLQIPPDLFTR